MGKRKSHQEPGSPVAARERQLREQPDDDDNDDHDDEAEQPRDTAATTTTSDNKDKQRKKAKKSKKGEAEKRDGPPLNEEVVEEEEDDGEGEGEEETQGEKASREMSTRGKQSARANGLRKLAARAGVMASDDFASSAKHGLSSGVRGQDGPFNLVSINDVMRLARAPASDTPGGDSYNVPEAKLRNKHIHGTVTTKAQFILQGMVDAEVKESLLNAQRLMRFQGKSETRIAGDVMGAVLDADKNFLFFSSGSLPEGIITELRKEHAGDFHHLIKEEDRAKWNKVSEKRRKKRAEMGKQVQHAREQGEKVVHKA
tara:strand:+ start:324 stop:1265 length:942 start_codon:yes stop_codon:yes gene_type:complete